MKAKKSWGFSLFGSMLCVLFQDLLCFWGEFDNLSMQKVFDYKATASDAFNFRFKHYGRAPRGVSGVKRSKISCQIRFWQFEALIFNKNWKNAKNAKNDLKNHCFWPYFDSLLTFSWILALETNKFVFSTNFQNFWHPGHPWERIRSGDILVFVLIFKNSGH